MTWRSAVLGALFAALAHAAPSAAAISGVCPDGSIFIVQSADAIPCREAKRVDPIDLPPLQPEMLPRPYGWERFNRRADPNNPYNLIETGRPDAAAPPSTAPLATGPPAFEAPATAPVPPASPPTPQVAAAPPAVPMAPRSLALALNPSDVTDLDQIVALSQSVAPATLSRYGA